MKSAYKWMLLTFGVISIIKIALSYFVAAPTIFADEYVYSKMAEGIHQKLFADWDSPIEMAYPPAYPILISFAYFFDNMAVVYFIIKILNALMSTTILIPAYLLFREFFDEKISRNGALLVAVAPFSFATAPYIMSENLFAPLFLASTYLILKALNENRTLYPILAGVFTGLTILTRYIGFVLLIGAITGLLSRENRLAKLKKLVIAAFVAAVIVLPFIVLSYFSGEAVTDLVSSTIVANKSSNGLLFNTLAFILWGMAHAAYLLLASGGLLWLYALTAQGKDEKGKSLVLITFTMIFSMILVLSKRALNLGVKEITPFAWLPGRIIGRYIDFFIPLIIVIGYFGLMRKDKETAPSTLTLTLASLILFAGSLLFYFPLFPFNNLSLSFFGAVKTGLEYFLSGNLVFDYVSPTTLLLVSASTISVLWIFRQLMKKSVLTAKRVFVATLVFFLISSSVSYGATMYNSQKWNNDEQMILGRYINELEGGGRLLFDERNCKDRITMGNETSLCRKNGSGNFIGFWTKREIIVTSVEEARKGDLVVTRESLDYSLIKETSGGIKLYRKD